MKKRKGSLTVALIIVTLLLSVNMKSFAELMQEIFETEVEEHVEEIISEPEDKVEDEILEGTVSDETELDETIKRIESEDIEEKTEISSFKTADGIFENEPDDRVEVEIDLAAIDSNVPKENGFQVVNNVISLLPSEEGFDGAEHYQYVLRGTTDSKSVVVEAGVKTKVTLKNASIMLNSIAPISVKDNSELELYLKGEDNVVNSSVSNNAGMAAIYVYEKGKLIIGDGETEVDKVGRIAVTGAYNAAGIGGSNGKAAGEIIIEGGRIVVTGGLNCPGIGSGRGVNGKKIVINGGEVRATGGTYGAGIGGGLTCTGGEIIINGGKVIAIAGSDGNRGDIAYSPYAIGAGAPNKKNLPRSSIYIDKKADVTAYGGREFGTTYSVKIKKSYAIEEEALIDGENPAYIINAYMEDKDFSRTGVTKINIYEESDMNTCVRQLEMPVNTRCYAYTNPTERTDVHVIVERQTEQWQNLLCDVEDNIFLGLQNDSFKSTEVKLLEGQISGTLWLDNNINGVRDNNEPGIPSQKVDLYKLDEKTGTEYKRFYSVNTDSSGNYKFSVGDGKYKVKFPQVKYYEFTVENTATGGHYTDEEGKSKELEISKLNQKQLATANAGYIAPKVENYLDFEKNVKNPNAAAGEAPFTDEISVKDIDEILEYRLSFKLPNNMAGYHQLSVEDTLPYGLEIRWDSGYEPRVYLGDAIDNLGDQHDVLSKSDYDDKTRTLSYQFESDDTTPAFGYLADKYVTLVVYSQMKTTQGIYPQTFINNGDLFVNNWTINEIMEEQDPDPVNYEEKEFKAIVNLEEYGVIEGIAFHNLDGSGIYNAGIDPILSNTVVELCDENGASISDGKGNDETICTTSNVGTYRFVAPLDTKYRIKFPTTLNAGPLVQQGADTEPNASHVNKKTGYSEEVTLNKDDRRRMVNGGYYKPVPDGAGITKTINGKPSYVTADVDETIIYTITATLPKSLTGYSDIRIADVLPAGLELNKAADIVVKVGDKTISTHASDFIESQEGNRVKVNYKADMSELSSGSVVTIALPAKLQSGFSPYPTEAMVNEAFLTLDGDDVPITANKPEFYIKGKISGYAFLVEEGKSKRTEGIGRSEIEVELYQKVGNGYSETPVAKTKTTGADGHYEFLADMNETYKVKFIDPSNAKAGFLDEGDIDEPDDNHVAGSEGFTQEFEVDNDEKRLRTINAGYIQPNADKIDLVKEVWDEDAGKWDDSIKVTSKTEPITYRLTFTLPADVSGYDSITLQDMLPKGLLLWDAVIMTNSVKLLVDEAEYTKAELSYTEIDGKNTVRTTFNGDLLSELAGAKIEMQLTTKLDPELIDEISELRNIGQLIIIPKTVNPGEGKIFIKGILFADKDGNGICDGSDELLTREYLDQTASIPVVLYQQDNSGTIDIDGKAYKELERCLSIDGTYQFEVPEGTYRVRFATAIEGRDLTITKELSVAKGSHARQTDGYTEAIEAKKAAEGNTTYEANAGYYEPKIDPPKNLNFSKTVLDETGTSGKEMVISSKEQVLIYQLSVQLPDDASNYQSIRIEDILPSTFWPATFDKENDISISAKDKQGKAIVIESLDGTKGIEPDNQTGPYTMYYEFAESYDFIKLAGATVTMEVKVKLSESLDSLEELLGTTIKNSGKLIVNKDEAIDLPDKEKPEVTIKGEITGIVFGDNDHNRQLSREDERQEGQKVFLWKENKETDVYEMCDETETKADGSYKFIIDVDDSAYKVQFPKQIAGQGLIEKGEEDNVIASHPYMSSGMTAETTMKATLDKLSCVRNAGYDEPNAQGKLTFTKKVKDKNGDYKDSITLTDPEQIIVYELAFNIGADVSGIYSVEVSDVLPEALELATGDLHKDVKVKVGGITVNNADGVLNQIDRKIFYKFADSYDFAKLKDKTVTMEISAKLNSTLTTYPESIVNKGLLLLNEGDGNGGGGIEPPDPEKPGVEAGGTIEGILWYDANEDGIIDSNEKGITGKTVILEKLNKDGKWESVKAVQTGSDGSYRFETGYGTYRVVFPDLEPDVRLDDKVTGELKLTKEDNYYRKDCGYLNPEVELPDAKDFTKSLVDKDGNPVQELEVRNTDDPINYLISLQLGDMIGYETMEIRDKLDDRLSYIDAVVKVSGVNVTKTAGTSSHNSKTNTYSYIFRKPLDKELLANQKVEILLTVKIRDGVTDYTDIGNVAKLLVNGGNDNNGGNEGGGNETGGGSEIDTGGGDGGENPNITFPYGYIHGYVFLDENDNNTREAGKDTPVRNAKVILYKKNGDKWIEVASTKTDSNGMYIFDQVEYGEYRIEIEHNLKDVKYVIQNAGKNYLNGIGSDVNEHGVVEFKIDKDNKHPIPTAGLKKVKGDNNGGGNGGDGNGNNGGGNGNGSSGGGENGDDKVFTKTPSQEEVKAGDIVEYTISGFGNGIGKDMKRYSVADILPEGLHFKSMKLPAFKKGSGIVFDVVYMTNQSAGRTKTLQSGLSAANSYTVKAPDLAVGEQIEFVAILIDKVPHGFGMGDSIVVTCQVDDNPPNLTLINDAALGYDDVEIMAKTNTLGVGGAPKTGDMSDFVPYTMIPVLALLIAAGCYRYNRKRRNG